MHIIFGVLALFLHLALLGQARPNLDEWSEFKQQFGKQYLDQDEDTMRMNIFSNNKKLVEKFNREESSRRGFKLGINHLSDWTDSEIKRLNGVRIPDDFKFPAKNSAEAQKFVDSFIKNNSYVDQVTVDWRDVPNRVSHVKDQGDCGSCWAFSTTGVLEGQEVVHNMDSIVTLSEQNLIDCDITSRGCDGGWPYSAYSSVRNQGGIEDDSSYPYSGFQEGCKFSPEKVAFMDNGGAYVQSESEESLKDVVANYGPVSVIIDASDPMFTRYESGIYRSESCKNKPENGDHAVLVVGFGSDPVEGDYWIIKNSWGSDWGDNGYIKMARNNDNMCGIANFGSIATF